MDSRRFVDFFKNILSGRVKEYDTVIRSGNSQNYSRDTGILAALESIATGVDTVHADFIKACNEGNTNAFSSMPAPSAAPDTSADASNAGN